MYDLIRDTEAADRKMLLIKTNFSTIRESTYTCICSTRDMSNIQSFVIRVTAVSSLKCYSWKISDPRSHPHLPGTTQHIRFWPTPNICYGGAAVAESLVLPRARDQMATCRYLQKSPEKGISSGGILKRSTIIRQLDKISMVSVTLH